MQLNCEVTDLLWPWDRSIPVLMLHGFSRNAAVWTRWLPGLSADHRVYRVDLPGMGGSSAPPPDFVWNETSILNGMLEVLDRFGLERVHWVGESSGGMIGTLFAAAFPQRVASLVMVETPLRRSASLQASQNVGQSSNVEAIEKLGVEEWCRRTVGLRLDCGKANPELIEWYIQQLAKTPVAISTAMKIFANTLDLEPVLEGVKVPVLLLYGDKSKVLTLDQVEVLKNKVPGIEMRVFPGYGHGLHVLESQACVEACIDFWGRKVPDTGRRAPAAARKNGLDEPVSQGGRP